MKQRLSNISLYQTIGVLGKLLLLLIAGFSLVVLLLLPDIATSLGIHQASLLWPNLQTAQLPTVSPSNGNPGSSQNSQAQQVLTEGQNDIGIANAIVTFTGVFVGIVAVAVTIAGFFGISELLKIRELRGKLQSDIKETNENAAEVKGQLATIVQDFKEQFGIVAQHTMHIEDHLKQLDKRIEIESQKFIEASFYYSEGSKAYRNGDNEHAIEFYLRALKLQPGSLPLLERLGRAYSNVDDIDKAFKYLNAAFEIDPENEAVLRSLALYYRYSELDKAVEYLERIVQKNLSAFEAWDFLGLCFRDQLVRNQELIKDQSLIDSAIESHEKALAIKERPETEFYLGILLYYSPKGDKIRAKHLILSAYDGTLQQEHDLRIREVWKILIHAGVPIVNDNKDEALNLVKSATQFITTQRILGGVQIHLRFLLEGVGHKEWIPVFMDTVKLRES